MGYWVIKMPQHPHAQSKGYCLAHRLVAEQYLGRYLEPEEVVHHINGDTTDNRIENLMVFACSASHTALEKRQRPAPKLPEGFSKGHFHPERDIILDGRKLGRKARDKRLKQLAQQSIRELQFRRSLAA